MSVASPRGAKGGTYATFRSTKIGHVHEDNEGNIEKVSRTEHFTWTRLTLRWDVLWVGSPSVRPGRRVCVLAQALPWVWACLLGWQLCGDIRLFWIAWSLIKSIFVLLFLFDFFSLCFFLCLRSTCRKLQGSNKVECWIWVDSPKVQGAKGRSRRWRGRRF